MNPKRPLDPRLVTHRGRSDRRKDKLWQRWKPRRRRWRTRRRPRDRSVMRHQHQALLKAPEIKLLLQRRIQALKDKRAAKEEKARYEKLAETMHRKRVERLKRKEKRNKMLRSWGSLKSWNEMWTMHSGRLAREIGVTFAWWDGCTFEELDCPHQRLLEILFRRHTYLLTSLDFHDFLCQANLHWKRQERGSTVASEIGFRLEHLHILRDSREYAKPQCQDASARNSPIRASVLS